METSKLGFLMIWRYGTCFAFARLSVLPISVIAAQINSFPKHNIMKQTATHLIALVLLAAFLLGAAVSYLVFADSSVLPPHSYNDTSALVRGKNVNQDVTTRTLAKEKSLSSAPCRPPNGEFALDSPNNQAVAGKNGGPTLAFPTKLPPLPQGHVIEVGVELEQVIRK